MTDLSCFVGIDVSKEDFCVFHCDTGHTYSLVNSSAGLEIAGSHRDLALFNLAIDSKLRGCDLVMLKVADVFVAGQMKERASIIQSKTQNPVRFEITEGTRKSLK